MSTEILINGPERSRLHNLHQTPTVFIKPNSQEVITKQLYDVIAPYILSTLNEGTSLDYLGKKTSLKLYKEGDMCLYLFTLGVNIYNFMVTEGTYLDRIKDSNVVVRYRLECLRDRLVCLSKNSSLNYVKIWSQMEEIVHIPRLQLGIGTMTINSTFIVQ